MSVVTRNITKRIVPGVGPKDAEIMIVGEAPGEMEERVGQPFVGKAGHLLNDLLHKSGILRQTCYITNVIKERPPSNDIKAFIKLDGKIPKVSKEYQDYLEILKSEIEEVNPNVIVAAGAVPLFALAGIRGITKWRGSIIPSSLVEGKKVIPIIHPAAALRQYSWRHFINFDLKRVRIQSKSPDVPEDRRQYYLRPSFDTCIQFLEVCKRQSMVAFDIEVSGGAITCISFAYSTDEAISIPFVKDGVDHFTIPQESEIWKRIADILEDPKIEKVGQNVMFDSSFLCREYGIVSKNMQDTMVAQGILTPDFPKGLAFITSIHTLIPYYKDEGKSVIKNQLKGFQQEGLGWQERFWLYNAKDSIVLMEAFPKQVDELIKMGNFEAYRSQVALIEPLLFITERGIRMDVERMRKQAEGYDNRIAGLETELEVAAGKKLNPRSPKQLLQHFYVDRGLKPYLEKGKPTTNEKALKRMSIRGVKEATILLEHRKLSKLNGTYLKMKLDSDNRLRSSINPVGARTGRLSSSKTIYGTGANIQNQPPIMKQYMLPDEGYVAYNVDLSQAENRLVAYVGPDMRMIEAFEGGIDIHSQTASLIFHIPVDEIKQMDDDDVKCTTIGGGRYTHRFWGKKANHSLNYGFGPVSFALLYEIQEKESRYIIEQYHRAYPGVRKYHLMIQEQLKKNYTLTNLFGRKYRFTSQWGEELFKEGYAFIPQSTVADKINRHGLIYLYYNQDIFQPLELMMQVHDSIAFQIPLDTGFEEHARMINLLKESLEQPLTWMGRSFKIPMDLSIHVKNLKSGIAIKSGSIPQENDKLAEKLRRAYTKLNSDGA